MFLANEEDVADNAALTRLRLEAAEGRRARETETLRTAVATIEDQVARVAPASLASLIASLDRARARGLARLAREEAIAMARARRRGR